MAAIALIRFFQPAALDLAGRAAVGTLFSGLGSVTVENDTPTDIDSWEIDLCDAPPDSTNFPQSNFSDGSGGRQVHNLASAADNTPTTTFDPDVAGCYRIRTTVRDSLGVENVDVRVFAVPDANNIIRPPYQKIPDALPVLGSGLAGEKPEEMNFGGGLRGWAGDSSPILLDEFMRSAPGTDVNAIHDNVAGEITAIPTVTVDAADHILIEDDSDSDNKKSILASDLQSGTDPNAIHDNVAGEIAGITPKVTPVSADHVLIEDSVAGDVKRRTTAGAIASSGAPAAHALGGSEHTSATLAELNALVSDATLDDSAASRPPSGTASGQLSGSYPSPTVDDGADGSAIHDDVSSEISVIASKGTPIAGDFLIIEDSAAGNAKKSVTIGSLPAGGGGGIDIQNVPADGEGQRHLYYNRAPRNATQELGRAWTGTNVFGTNFNTLNIIDGCFMALRSGGTTTSPKIYLLTGASGTSKILVGDPMGGGFTQLADTTSNGETYLSGAVLEEHTSAGGAVEPEVLFTGRVFATSNLQRFSASSGALLDTFASTGAFGTVHFDGTNAWAVGSDTNVGSGNGIFKITNVFAAASGMTVTAVTGTGVLTSNGNGSFLTDDGTSLWFVDSSIPSTIYQIALSGTSVTNSFTVPNTAGGGGMAWDGRYIWYGSALAGAGLVRFDPSDQTTATFDVKSDRVQQIEFDGTYLVLRMLGDTTAPDTAMLARFDPQRGKLVDTLERDDLPGGNSQGANFFFVPKGTGSPPDIYWVPIAPSPEGVIRFGEIRYEHMRGLAVSKLFALDSAEATTIIMDYDDPPVVMIDTTAATQVTLPPFPGQGLIIVIKDSTGNAGTANITIVTSDLSTIDGIAGVTGIDIITNRGFRQLYYHMDPATIPGIGEWKVIGTG